MPKYGQWGGPGGPGAVLNLPGISLSAVRIADGQSELSGAWCGVTVCHAVLASHMIRVTFTAV